MNQCLLYTFTSIYKLLVVELNMFFQQKYFNVILQTQCSTNAALDVGAVHLSLCERRTNVSTFLNCITLVYGNEEEWYFFSNEV